MSHQGGMCPKLGMTDLNIFWHSICLLHIEENQEEGIVSGQ